jgi:integrase
LWKRGKTFYFKIPGRRWATTGQSVRADAEAHAIAAIHKTPPPPRRRTLRANLSLGDYLRPFYGPECPHIRRLRDEGKSIGEAYTYGCRQLIKKKILPDPVADVPVQDLRRADLLDFRSRLSEKYGPRTCNRTLQIIKTALTEGCYREELTRNPALGIGQKKYKQRAVGIFSEEEIKRMFGECPGPWADRMSWTAFLTLYSCGLRRGELMALAWRSIDFERAVVRITAAVKTDAGEVGPPKWGRERWTPLPRHTTQALREWRKATPFVLPGCTVFHDAEGRMLRRTWVTKTFGAAMQALGIDAKVRSLRPHSLRHTLATHLAATGYDAERIRAAMGWTTAAVQAQDTHLQPEHLRGQADAVDKLFG